MIFSAGLGQSSRKLHTRIIAHRRLLAKLAHPIHPTLDHLKRDPPVGPTAIVLLNRTGSKLHGSPAVAVYDPRLGAVIVASHHPDYHEGQVLDVQTPDTNPGDAIS